jgi:hypothetical protein
MNLNKYYLVHEDDLSEETKSTAIPAIKLADASYEAGKMDKELSYMFDNPKGRFLNSEIEL